MFDGFIQGDLTEQIIRKTALTSTGRHVTSAEVRIDQQYLLPVHCNQSSEVLRNKRFTAARRKTRYKQNLGIHHRKFKRSSQCTQRFTGNVFAVYFHQGERFHLFHFFHLSRFRNLSVNAYARFAFHIARRTDTTARKQTQHKDQTGTENKSTRDESEKNHQLTRLHRLDFNTGIVHNTHITDFAGLHHAELLNVVQHIRVNGVVYIHITLQTEDFLLLCRKVLRLFAKLCHFTAELVLLFLQRENRRVIFLKQPGGFFILLLQFEKALFELHSLFKNSTRFSAQIN